MKRSILQRRKKLDGDKGNNKESATIRKNKFWLSSVYIPDFNNNNDNNKKIISDVLSPDSTYTNSKEYEKIPNAVSGTNDTQLITKRLKTIREKVRNATDTLNLMYSEIDDSDATLIAKWLIEFGNGIHLKFINLRDNKIKDKGAKAIAEVLMGNMVIEDIDLTFNNVNDKGMIAISSALRTSKKLRKVRVANNEIGKEGAKAVAEMLMGNEVLEEIHLSANKLEDDGISAIASAFRTHKKLRVLKVNNTYFGNNGAKAIADMLRGNEVLEDIDLSFNSIGNGAAKDIAKMLRGNEVLKRLNLSINKLEDDGISAIASALRTNKKLTVFNVRGNRIRNKGAKAIAEMLRGNEVLKCLYLQNNLIGPKGYKLLTNALKQNPNSVCDLYIDGNPIELQVEDKMESKVDDDNEDKFEDAMKSTSTGTACKENETRRELSKNLRDLNVSDLRLLQKTEHESTTIRNNKSLPSPNDILHLNDNNKKIISDVSSSATINTVNNSRDYRKILNVVCGTTENRIITKRIEKIRDKVRNNKMLQALSKRKEGGIKGNSVYNDEVILTFSDTTDSTSTESCKDGSEKTDTRHINERLEKILDKVHHKTDTLDLSNYGLDDCDAKSIAKWIIDFDIGKSLKKIYLGSNKFSIIGITAIVNTLRGNTVINHIDISNNYLGDGMKNIAKEVRHNKIWKNLKVLNVRLCRIEDGGAKILADMLRGNKVLERIELADNIITDKGIIDITSVLCWDNLTHVFLANNRFGRVGTSALAVCLAKSEKLLALDVCGNKVDSEGIDAIVENLKKNRRGHTVRILNNSANKREIDISLENKNGRHILSVYSDGNPTELEEKNKIKPDDINTRRIKIRDDVYYATETLDLENRGINDSDAELIVELIIDFGKVSQLKGILLSRNKIGNKGVKAIVGILKNNKVLQDLDLSSNQIGDDGIESITPALLSNHIMRNINLANNKFGSKSMISLAECFSQSNNTLKTINLNGNKVGRSGIQAILQHICRNDNGHNLEHIYLSATGIGNEEVSDIVKKVIIKQGKSSWTFELYNLKSNNNGGKVIANSLKGHKCEIHLNDNSNNVTDHVSSLTEFTEERKHTALEAREIRDIQSDASSDTTDSITSIENDESEKILDVVHNNVAGTGIIDERNERYIVHNATDTLKENKHKWESPNGVRNLNGKYLGSLQLAENAIQKEQTHPDPQAVSRRVDESHTSFSQEELQNFMKKISEIQKILNIDRGDEIVRRSELHSFAMTELEKEEFKAIESNEIAREFYSSMYKTLDNTINACKTLASGMVEHSQEESIRSRLSTTVKDMSWEKLKENTSIKKVVTETIKWAARQIPFPCIEAAGSVICAIFHVVSSIKEERDKYLAFSNVTAFTFFAQHHSCIHLIISRVCRYMVRGGLHLKTKPDYKPWQEWALRMLGEKSSTANTHGHLVAEQVLKLIMLTTNYLDGKDAIELVLASSVLNMDCKAVAALVPFQTVVPSGNPNEATSKINSTSEITNKPLPVTHSEYEQVSDRDRLDKLEQEITNLKAKSHRKEVGTEQGGPDVDLGNGQVMMYKIPEKQYKYQLENMQAQQGMHGEQITTIMVEMHQQRELIEEQNGMIEKLLNRQDCTDVELSNLRSRYRRNRRLLKKG